MKNGTEQVKPMNVEGWKKEWKVKKGEGQLKAPRREREEFGGDAGSFRHNLFFFFLASCLLLGLKGLQGDWLILVFLLFSFVFFWFLMFPFK